MRLTCPECGAIYEVEEGLIPAEGRDVQCSSCEALWHARPEGGSEPVEAPEAATEAPRAPARDEGPRPREIDARARDILREEAARETAARREAAIPRAGTWPIDGAAGTHDADRPIADAPAEGPRWGDARDAPRRGGGFGLGFGLMMVLAALLVATYLLAPRIAEALPRAERPLGDYVAGVNELRARLDIWANAGSDTLSGILGDAD